MFKVRITANLENVIEYEFCLDDIVWTAEPFVMFLSLPFLSIPFLYLSLI